MIKKLSPGGKLVDYRHKYRHDKTYNDRRSLTDSEYLGFYHSRDWQQLRKSILERDLYLCQRCGRQGNIVDHIIPSKDHWELREDPGNLQTLCRKCHDAKTKREWFKREKGVKRAMQIYLVCGLDSKAKLGYIKQHLTAHDLIFDYDLLMQAQTGLRFGQHNDDLYDYIALYLEQLVRQLRTETRFTNVWITSTLPRENVDNLLSTYFDLKRILVRSKHAVKASQKLYNEFNSADWSRYTPVIFNGVG